MDSNPGIQRQNVFSDALHASNSDAALPDVQRKENFIVRKIKGFLHMIGLGKTHTTIQVPGFHTGKQRTVDLPRRVRPFSSIEAHIVSLNKSGFPKGRQSVVDDVTRALDDPKVTRALNRFEEGRLPNPGECEGLRQALSALVTLEREFQLSEKMENPHNELKKISEDVARGGQCALSKRVATPDTRRDDILKLQTMLALTEGNYRAKANMVKSLQKDVESLMRSATARERFDMTRPGIRGGVTGGGLRVLDDEQLQLTSKEKAALVNIKNTMHRLQCSSDISLSFNDFVLHFEKEDPELAHVLRNMRELSEVHTPELDKAVREHLDDERSRTQEQARRNGQEIPIVVIAGGNPSAMVTAMEAWRHGANVHVLRRETGGIQSKEFVDLAADESLARLAYFGGSEFVQAFRAHGEPAVESPEGKIPAKMELTALDQAAQRIVKDQEGITVERNARVTQLLDPGAGATHYQVSIQQFAKREDGSEVALGNAKAMAVDYLFVADQGQSVVLQETFGEREAVPLVHGYVLEASFSSAVMERPKDVSAPMRQQFAQEQLTRAGFSLEEAAALLKPQSSAASSISSAGGRLKVTLSEEQYRILGEDSGKRAAFMRAAAILQGLGADTLQSETLEAKPVTVQQAERFISHREKVVGQVGRRQETRTVQLQGGVLGEAAYSAQHASGMGLDAAFRSAGALGGYIRTQMLCTDASERRDNQAHYEHVQQAIGNRLIRKVGGDVQPAAVEAEAKPPEVAPEVISEISPEASAIPVTYEQDGLFATGYVDRGDGFAVEPSGYWGVVIKAGPFVGKVVPESAYNGAGEVVQNFTLNPDTGQIDFLRGALKGYNLPHAGHQGPPMAPRGDMRPSPAPGGPPPAVPRRPTVLGSKRELAPEEEKKGAAAESSIPSPSPGGPPREAPPPPKRGKLPESSSGRRDLLSAIRGEHHLKSTNERVPPKERKPPQAEGNRSLADTLRGAMSDRREQLQEDPTEGGDEDEDDWR